MPPPLICTFVKVSVKPGAAFEVHLSMTRVAFETFGSSGPKDTVSTQVPTPTTLPAEHSSEASAEPENAAFSAMPRKTAPVTPIKRPVGATR